MFAGFRIFAYLCRMITANNPFKYGKIVKGKHFYDRIEMTEQLAATLSGGNNIVLYAPRRMGKSSLVANVFELLQNNGFHTIWFDLMSVYSIDTFTEQYSKAILEHSNKSPLDRVKQIAEKLKGINPTVSFDNQGNPRFSIQFQEYKTSQRTLEEVIDLPEKLASKKQRYIVAFDEFQEITKLQDVHFEKLLRSKIQHHQNVTYIFFGSRVHTLKAMFNDKNRAFYNAAKVVHLSEIDRQESIKYLQNGFKETCLSLSKELANSIIDISGNIPYYIQMLASEIWQQVIVGSRQITRATIQEATSNIITLKGDYYLELFEHQSAYRKKLLQSLAISGKNIFSKEYENTFRLSATSTTQKAVKILVEEGLVDRQEDSYFICDPFFKMFIKSKLS